MRTLCGRLAEYPRGRAPFSTFDCEQEESRICLLVKLAHNYLRPDRNHGGHFALVCALDHTIRRKSVFRLYKIMAGLVYEPTRSPLNRIVPTAV